MKRVLILEPYFGGSHRQFLQGLQKYLIADYTVLTLPARKWKKRMQLSAPWFIEKINGFTAKDRYYDHVLCSTFVDVAVLRGLLSQVAGWNHNAKILTYFHENQFVYPERFSSKNNYQFTAINFYSALASDNIAFNSIFNRDSFFDGCRKFIQSASDMKLSGVLGKLIEKSCILYPGIDFSEIDRLEWKEETEVPVIIWNHRWEHDKDPESFFCALQELKERRVDFRLIVMGQSFSSCPSCFIQAREQFQANIIHYGFVESYRKYAELLGQGDLVVSTSLHEFYGISIIEAVRAGCIPVLPNRLSYPELFDKKHLYKEDLPGKLEEVIKSKRRLSRHTATTMTDQFCWQNLRGLYREWFS